MKAILVIDMPKTCGGCPCMRVSNTGFVCQMEWRDIDPDHIPSWCPLKPMPEPKPIKQEIMGEDYYIGFYGQGWNDCIKEIENND